MAPVAAAASDEQETVASEADEAPLDAGLEQLAADVEETSSELTFLDTGSGHDASTSADVGITPASAEEEFENTGDGVVSYSEPAIAPSPDRPYLPHRPTPIASLRVPDIPDLDLHVAAALETTAQRIRAGELHLPPVDGVGDEASSLALALAALLAGRH